MIPVKMIVHSQNGKLLTWFHLNYSHAQFNESRKGENFGNHHLVTPKICIITMGTLCIVVIAHSSLEASQKKKLQILEYKQLIALQFIDKSINFHL